MPSPLVTKASLITNRQALLVHVDMSEYLIDYYLHRKQFAAGTLAAHDEKLKDLIACLAIHLTVRPATEDHAWTLHLIDEHPYSLFCTGGIEPHRIGEDCKGTLVGHILTDYVRHTDVNSFHSQFLDIKGQQYRSYVQCETAEISEMVEHYYGQSEQLPLRVCIAKDSDTAIGLAALPDFDRTWFETVDLVQIASDRAEPSKQMRLCRLDFSCKCSPEALLPFFRSLPKDEIEELYGSDAEILVTCPRCGRQFGIDRTTVTAS